MNGDAVADYERFLALDPDLLADPYPTYHRLQAEQPVFWSESQRAWIVTRYADFGEHIRDPRLSSERAQNLADRLPAEQRAATPSGGMLTMLWRDEPDHSRLRSLVNKAFTPRMVEAQRPRIQAVVDHLLDGMADAGEADFMRDFAVPLPIIVIAEMIGVPPADRDRLKRWSDAGADALGRVDDPAGAQLRAREAGMEFAAYLHDHVERRRAQPRDDLLSALIAAEERGDTLSEPELIANTFLLLAAGNETTTNLLGNGLLTLFRHPDQRARLAADPALVESAVEEMLRYESPIQGLGRRTRAEVEIGGRRIPADTAVAFSLGAINRDPAQFPDPDTFDVARRENRHMAFGHGPHFCLGAPLALLEARVSFPAILRRFPALRPLAERADWRPNPSFRGLTTLPVEVG